MEHRPRPISLTARRSSWPAFIALVLSSLLVSFAACAQEKGATGAAGLPPETLDDVVETSAAEPASANQAPSCQQLGGDEMAVAPISDAAKEQVTAVANEVKKFKSLKKASFSALVIDQESGEVVFENDRDLKLMPASNTKLFTTATALSLLGPDYRFETPLAISGDVDEEGVLDGDVYLLGVNDFTWSSEFHASAREPLDYLAEELAGYGIREVDGAVLILGEFLYEGQRYGTYDAEFYRDKVKDRFEDALKAADIKVAKLKLGKAKSLPEGAEIVATWRSVPLRTACAKINQISHNEFADSLLRHIGLTQEGEASYPAGVKAELAWLESAGVDIEDMQFHDGSGLSHDNKVSAAQVVSLIDTMLEGPYGEIWMHTLSISGEVGTFGGRLRGEDTRGRVFVKSGTLDGAITSCGVLHNRHDGRRYLFALLYNNNRSRKTARKAQDRIIEAFAGNLRGIESRPSAPLLLAVGAHEGQVRAKWRKEAGISTYRVWLSEEGHQWEAKNSLLVTGDFAEICLPEGWQQAVVRVTAVGEMAESDPSDSYCARAGEAPEILIVDAYDRWTAEPQHENTLGSNHDFAAMLALDLPERAFDTVSNDAILDGRVRLERYPIVYWMVGEDSGEWEALSAAEQAILQVYLEGEGALFISGSELGYDLETMRGEEDKAFHRQILSAQYLSDDAGTWWAEGESELEELSIFSFYCEGGLEASTPDRLRPAGEAEAWLHFVDDEAAAAVATTSPHKVVYLAFPYEAMPSQAERQVLARKAMGFLLD